LARADLWMPIRAIPALDWILLTKGPQNIVGMLPVDWGEGWPNVWLGTTTENQIEAARRIPHLVAIPAAVRFLSVEPMLKAIDLSPWLGELSCAIVGGESGIGNVNVILIDIQALAFAARAGHVPQHLLQDRQQKQILQDPEFILQFLIQDCASRCHGFVCVAQGFGGENGEPRLGGRIAFLAQLVGENAHDDFLQIYIQER